MKKQTEQRGTRKPYLVRVQVMCSPLLCALFVFSLLCTSTPLLLGQDWEKLWVTSQQNDLSGYLVHPSLIIDSNAILHVIFTESDQIDQQATPAIHTTGVQYTNNKGGRFTSLTTIAGGKATAYTSLALDSTSRLHAINTPTPSSANNVSCIGYIAQDTDGWEQQGAGDCNEQSQTFPATAVDRNGTLHVVYIQAGAVYYKSRSNNAIWTNPVNLSKTSNGDQTPVVAVASDGTVHVLFYRWHSTDRRVLMYTKGINGVFSAPETLRTMSGVSSGMEATGTGPSFVPSITLDANDACHIVFTSVFGTNPETGQLLYMNTTAGDWSEVQSISGIRFYNRAIIAVTEDGKIHVAAERFDRSQNDWDIVYIQGSNGSWDQEKDLTQNAVDDIAPVNGGRFIQSRNSSLAIIYQTKEPDPNGLAGNAHNHIAVLTQNVVPRPALSVSLEEIDFGTLALNSCQDSVVVINNIGGGQFLYSAIPSLSGQSTHFSLPNNDGFNLISDGQDTVRIRFCPQDTGCFSAELTIQTNGGEQTIQLVGCAVQKLVETTEHLIWIDTANGHVGDKLYLNAHISPTLTNDERLDSFRVELHYNPRAFYIHHVEGDGIPDERFSIERQGPGRTIITGRLQEPLEREILFRLRLEGLTTGNPENIITVENVVVNGIVGTVQWKDGLLLLDGCDIGTGLGFANGKIVRIKSVNPSPVIDRAEIQWNAPKGFSPTLQIIDARGVVIKQQTLPPGTGEQQRIELQKEDLQPGWYLLQIIDRAERHSLPLLIAE